MNEGYDFGWALVQLKSGNKVRRKCWKNASFIFLVPGSEFKVNRPPLLGIYPEGQPISYRPHIDVQNTDGTIGTWSPSNGDALGEDWELV